MKIAICDDREDDRNALGVTLFLLLFSIITFASTIITNIATRKREYAMLQSIGMTRKQTWLMVLCESYLLVIGSLTITLILGFLLDRTMIQILVNAGVFFLSYTFPLVLFVLYCFAILLIVLAITFFAFHTMQKVSLVERLRIAD
ncbi:MAG: FtsX-like permease family protein [Bacillota bacterium]|nr:FtsX-like permease family protein [Bacillota bacterium]